MTAGRRHGLAVLLSAGAFGAALVGAGSVATAATTVPASHPASAYTVTASHNLLRSFVLGGRGVTTTSVGAIIQSDYVAGYVGAIDTHKATFTATVVVPTIDCSHKPANPAFVNEYLNGTLADGDMVGSGGGLQLSCTGTSANYIVYLDVDAQLTAEFATVPGDNLLYTGTATPNAESYSVRDEMSGAAGNDSGSGLTVHNLQLTTQGGYGAAGGFPGFTPIKYMKLKVDGSPFPDRDPAAYEQVDATSHVMIRASPIYANAFHLTFVTNS